MSIFNKNNEENKKEQKTKKSFAFVEEDSSTNDEAKNVNEFINSGRGETKTSFNPNPKGRPKLKKEDLKNETVMIYLTKEQKQLLSEKADRASLSVSKYILLKVFGID